MATHRVVQFQLAVLRQKHDGRGGELFCHGSPLKDRALRGRDVELHVRQAVTSGLNHRPVAHHCQGETGDLLFLELRFDITVDSVGIHRTGKGPTCESNKAAAHQSPTEMEEEVVITVHKESCFEALRSILMTAEAC